jgi:hypothetical protein
MTAMAPYEILNSLGNANVVYGANYHIQGVNRRSLTPAIVSSIFQKLLELANTPALNMAKPVLAITWDYHNVRKMSTVPSDATAFCMRRPNPVAAAFIMWEGDSQEASQEAKDRLREFKAYCEGALESDWEKTIDDVGYANYGESY